MGKGLKKVVSFVLLLAMVLGLCNTDFGAIQAKAAGSTTVYFYNSDGYEEVIAHAWGASGDLTGGWGTTKATASSIGGSWMEVTIASDPGFTVIFSDASDTTETRRTVVTIDSSENLYATMGNKTFASKAAAEEYIANSGDGDSSGDGEGSGDGDVPTTTFYFYNSDGWDEVHVYTWEPELFGGWPGTDMESADELGTNWWKLDVTAAFPYNLIINNNGGQQLADIVPTDDSDVFATTVGVYSSKAEAEAAVEEAVNGRKTTVYFLNYDGEKPLYDKVYAYAYANGQPIAEGWPGVEAERATDLGENWYKATFSRNAETDPFTVIFNNNSGGQLNDINITDYQNNYATPADDGKLFTTAADAADSVGANFGTYVYYLNSAGWESVGAYVYGGQTVAEPLGGWGVTSAEPAPEKGEMWYKVLVPEIPPFSIIFYCKDEGHDPDTERSELQIPNKYQVYVTGTKKNVDNGAFGSVGEAELAMGLGSAENMTELYFYNSRGWGDINCYVYRMLDGESVVVGNGWPGKAAEKAPEIGENWWKLSVPRVATEEEPFYVVFNDGANQTEEDIIINDREYVYIIAASQKFNSKEAAEAAAAAADAVYDDGCEEGPNADKDNYSVTYSGAGAALPYVTYEAEKATAINARVLPKATVYRESVQSEASGRSAVQLEQNGDYVEFTLTEAANTMVLRYSMPDSADGIGVDASLSMYINGTDAKDLALTSKYAWVYGGYPYNNNVSAGMAHRFFDETRLFFDETLPAGTKIRLQKDAADTADWYVIDFIECELVGAPLTQPANSLSVTEYGAIADDGTDDKAAFEACIAAATEQGKEVWIPAGTFDLVEKVPLSAAGVTIRGAGIWYSNLQGAGVSFHYSGTSKFYDFAMTGVSTRRDDSGDLACFENEGKSSNVTIQNIWMEHVKVGVWNGNSQNLAVQGCRIRNTYADGINLCSATNNAVVRNNSLRNTGDDCIAIWPWLADCSGNVIEHNTVQVPTLANGIAIYGGGNNVVDSNYVADIVNNGGGITVGSEFEARKGYTGPITVKNNVLDRCGSMQTDESYPIGAIWLWSSYNFPMTTGYEIRNNKMNDCPQEGILIECNFELRNVNMQYNVINGATDAIYVYKKEDGYSSAAGDGKYGNMTVSGLRGQLVNHENENFILTHEDEKDTPVIDTPVVADPSGNPGLGTSASYDGWAGVSAEQKAKLMQESLAQNAAVTAPKTDDRAPFAVAIVMLMAGAVVMVGIVGKKRRLQ